ncbi:hypothetical protein ASG17_02975 [Brevundimonas sp. Leaf363]|nr:hypothetical protein ASG17_02975 [Brevundimonas sp. Leaf363]
MTQGWLVEAEHPDGALIFKVKTASPSHAEELVRKQLGARRDAWIAVLRELSKDEVQQFPMFRRVFGPF